jgi:Uma2 family endonuclease
MAYREYLELEARSPEKHEYLRGEVWAMAGGTREHALYAMNFLRLVGDALAGRPCGAYGSDLRVRIDATDRTTYPDGIVICGPSTYSPEDPLAVTNPLLVLEVTSESSEADDRGAKFAHYRHLSSLKDYVLVSHREPRIEVYRRDTGFWAMTDAVAGQRVLLPSLEVTLEVDAVYFDPNRPTPS